MDEEHLWRFVVGIKSRRAVAEPEGGRLRSNLALRTVVCVSRNTEYERAFL